MNYKKVKLNSNTLYFRKDDDEVCYNLKNHLLYMIENDLKEMDLFLAKREKDSNYFFL